MGDEESTAVGWFGVGELPELDARQQRRIACALAERADCVFDL